MLPTDDEARALAQGLLAGAKHAALGVIDPATGGPLVTRIALGLDPAGCPLTLISDLSAHTAALKSNPACSIMVAGAADKGDPLTHPRLSLQGRAEFIRKGDDGYAPLAAHYLASHPKSKLYIDFADFSLVRLRPGGALLNGGFGKAYRLSPADLRPGH